MENNNEKVNMPNNGKNNNLLKEAIDSLEKNLKELKAKADVDGKNDTIDKIKDKALMLKDSAVKEIKNKYENADPQKQKMFIALMSALIGAMVTAIAFKGCGCDCLKNDKK